ncbi:MAG: YerC/YecD family TrpR-related protein [Oscillospiraceae bacterium]|nr:YerC/YecD family TrpR-related protein [Oscillospiraceae bacterium]
MNNKMKLSNRDSDLYRAILELRTPEESYAFFSDLCTVAEMKAMEQRFQIAQLLSRGMIYNDILEKTGASSATVSRVNRSLHLGMDSYRTLFARMEEKDE